MVFFRFAVVPALLACLACGCALPPAGPGRVIQMHVAKEIAQEGLEPAYVPTLRDEVYLCPEVVLNERDLQSAEVLRIGDAFGVGVTFTPTGVRRLKKATAANEGERLAIRLYGEVRSAPLIIEKFRGKNMIVATGLNRTQAEELVAALQGWTITKGR